MILVKHVNSLLGYNSFVPLKDTVKQTQENQNNLEFLVFKQPNSLPAVYSWNGLLEVEDLVSRRAVPVGQKVKPCASQSW